VKIVFADGEEMLLSSDADWRVTTELDADIGLPVLVVGSYGGPEYGHTNILRETSLAPAWFRQRVDVSSGLKRARLYLCALGQGRAFSLKLFINCFST
jgi:hypothetical protein